MGVAHTHVRESGLEAVRSIESLDRVGAGLPPERGYDTIGSDNPYIPLPPPLRSSHGVDPFASPAPSRQSDPFDDNRRSPTPTLRDHQSRESIPFNEYHLQERYANNRTSSYLDNPYNRVSTAWDPMVARGDIDPDAIDDDPEDGMTHGPGDRRSVGGSHGNGSEGMQRGGAAGSGGVLGALGGWMGNKNGGVRDPSGQYGPVGGPATDVGAAEKSDWLHQETSGRKKFRWIIGILITLVIIGAIVGGVIGALHRSNSNKDASSSSSSSSSSGSQQDEGEDLDKDSADIKKLMNNAGLHKVFPGVAYTPFNAQYPDCINAPPSQHNVTKDVAVLSQLTNTIRLYGTDCNQTEMVLHAIDKLALPNIKVWIGVWLDNNSTTGDRGIGAMYDILDKYGADPFAGVIVGNEVLYRQQMTETELGQLLSDVKSNFTEKRLDLPVATSDLGDNWTAGLASSVDVVMSNIHPFFAGRPVDDASSWTWNFWQTRDVVLTQNTSKKNVISEVGWPSAGGTDCGGPDTCDEGSVAGIDEMNSFMGDFICQSLANGTDFFW